MASAFPAGESVFRHAPSQLENASQSAFNYDAGKVSDTRRIAARIGTIDAALRDFGDVTLDFIKPLDSGPS
jgi:hypothetical protein